ncbi:hypothetical protein ACE7GA_02570 [Roseomonas sp. CCTCC AB2023176]|uniref:hypothetical protein n=1 Tax=Roseomonas sp. CCTCC AB2023176 TaxID=3342640 RepID=UPI0035D6BC18
MASAFDMLLGDVIAPSVPTAAGPRPHVLLDVSRLISAANHGAPSGIDRVEMAYARRWLSLPEEECTFAGQVLGGPFAALPRVGVQRFVEALTEAWDKGRDGPALQRARRLARGLMLRSASGFGQLVLGRRRGTRRARRFSSSSRTAPSTAPVRSTACGRPAAPSCP